MRLALLFCFIVPPAFLWAGEGWTPKPVPSLQTIPLPYDQVSFQRDGIELFRYHYAGDLRRPFLYPINGPSGRSLTRMGHPHDQETHSHHNSVWISHNDVNGYVFWGDKGEGTIRHKRIDEFEDGGEWAYTVTENEWVVNGNQVLLNEIRGNYLHNLSDGEYLIVIDLQLQAAGDTVTLGTTPFGMIGVRMAKTIGVNDGNGRIRNSEGAVNEKEVFWKRARWVDYSGAIQNGVIEGITLLDHPLNPNHPSHFHVRNDGWMGASLTYETPIQITKSSPLHLRYGLYIHNEAPTLDRLDAIWKRFSQLELPPSK